MDTSTAICDSTDIDDEVPDLLEEVVLVLEPVVTAVTVRIGVDDGNSSEAGSGFESGQVVGIT